MIKRKSSSGHQSAPCLSVHASLQCYERGCVIPDVPGRAGDCFIVRSRPVLKLDPIRNIMLPIVTLTSGSEFVLHLETLALVHSYLEHSKGTSKQGVYPFTDAVSLVYCAEYQNVGWAMELHLVLHHEVVQPFEPLYNNRHEL